MENRQIYDWFSSLENKSVNYVYKQFVEKFKVEVNCTEYSLYVKVNRIYQKVKVMLKNKNQKKLDLFLKISFVVPTKQTPHERSLAASQTDVEISLKNEVKQLKTENNNLKRKVKTYDELESEYMFQLKEIEKVNKDLSIAISSKKGLKDELSSIKKLYNENEKKLDAVEEKFKGMKIQSRSNKIRNLNKKDKI